MQPAALRIISRLTDELTSKGYTDYFILLEIQCSHILLSNVRLGRYLGNSHGSSVCGYKV